VVIDLESIPVPVDDVVGRTVHNRPDDRLEAVLVLPTRGRINVLNEIGARIWSLADGTRSVKEVAAAICEAYDIDLETAEKDTLEFLEILLDRGVIQLSDNPVV
jgi:hypothetical protein